MERKTEMKTTVMISILLMVMALMVYRPINKAESSIDSSTTKKLRGETFSPLSAPPTEWNKTYGGANIDAAWSMIQTSDGGYALAGYTESFGAGGQDSWLIKTDSVGNMIWSQTYGGANNDEAWSVIQTSDGGYALAGYTESFGAGHRDFWLVKTDSVGNMIWNKTYGGAGDDQAYSVIQTSDGGYALAGVGSDDFLLIKTDSVGNIIWGKFYGGADFDAAWSMIQTSDGGYALAGLTESFGAGGQDSWLIKTDSVGNVVWSQTYGGANGDAALSVIQTSDGGYALAGGTASFGAGMVDFWLVKVAPEGQYEHDVTVTDIMLSKTVVGQGYNMNVNVTVANQGEYTETFDVTLYADSGTPMNETGLVGYWNFDEGTGTIAHDSSGNNNDGTIYGATWTSGKYGNALQFDGIDDYVLCGSNSLPTGNDPRTVSLWFKAFDIPSDRNMILTVYGQPYAYDAFYLIIIGETKKVYVGMWGGGDTPSTTTSIQAGIWYHVTVTYDGTIARIYLNGIEEGSSPRSFATTLTDFHITDYWPEHYFNGIIDEVKVYNRALSADEVWAEYTRQTGFAIGTQTVTLESGASTTLTFTWNTAGFDKGNYTISAYAWPVPGETAIEDNTLTDGWVIVTIPGDVIEPYFKVDMGDIVTLCDAFGSKIGQPKYNPDYDINCDGKISMDEIIIAVEHFGQHYP
jgi:hypothetical protein